MNNPDITLCVLAYNRPKDLEHVMRSYLNQDYENSEMVIVDDKSSTNLKPTVDRWIKKDSRIRFHRNEKNLGLAKNFSESFKHCRGKYIVTLGDDDIFIDRHALSEYVEIFVSNKNLGLIRSRQVIVRNNKLYQVSAIGEKEVEVYSKGDQSLDKFVIETISMAGNAYRNDNLLKRIISFSESVYPQVELAAKIALFKSSAIINKYLIGVGSGENQLNVLTYKLNDRKTDILEDFYSIVTRVNQFAKKEKIKTRVDEETFLGRVIDYIIILLPYDSLKNGKISTLKFAQEIVKKRLGILFSPLFAISIGIVIMPAFFIKPLLRLINKIKLTMKMNKTQIIQINQSIFNSISS